MGCVYLGVRYPRDWDSHSPYSHVTSYQQTDASALSKQSRRGPVYLNSSVAVRDLLGGSHYLISYAACRKGMRFSFEL